MKVRVGLKIVGIVTLKSQSDVDKKNKSGFHPLTQGCEGEEGGLGYTNRR